MSNPILTYDFTLSASDISQSNLFDLLRQHCRSFTFQLEEGESGYKHYQGRFKLCTKARLSSTKNKLKLKTIHLSPTSNENIKNNFYVTKEETRIDGPWSDKDIPIYIPRQIKDITLFSLYPWQQTIINLSKEWDTRSIHIILDYKGNIGKSTLCTFMGVHGYGKLLPFVNNYKDLLRIVMDMPTQKCYIIDMPKAINKENLCQLYSGIETIKNGYAYDDRYHFKEKYFDSPNIFIFTNTHPDYSLLSKDRWILHEVINSKLISYKANTSADINGASL